MRHIGITETGPNDPDQKMLTRAVEDAPWEVIMLAYSLQLYFDFSGYSTMAVGLGLQFGLKIPQNFNSPYKADSPADFWRRWHISLSTFLRDYVYIPLGGGRRGWRHRKNQAA